MNIIRLKSEGIYWNKLIDYLDNCAWEEVGKHLSGMMRQNRFTDWESIFVAIFDGEIIGFCTFLKEDYFPENRYSPWISSIFVDEHFRGKRVSRQMIDTVISYAKEKEFSKVYIPSDIIGLYEKYGFVAVDKLLNYGGGVDTIFQKNV